MMVSYICIILFAMPVYTLFLMFETMIYFGLAQDFAALYTIRSGI